MSTPTGKGITSVHEKPLEALSLEFKESLDYCTKKLFDEPRVKKLKFGGQEQILTGDLLANYISEIRLKIKDTPKIKTVWENIFTAKCNSAIEEAEKLFGQNTGDFVYPVNINQNLEQTLDKEQQVAIEHFNSQIGSFSLSEGS